MNYISFKNILIRAYADQNKIAMGKYFFILIIGFISILGLAYLYEETLIWMYDRYVKSESYYSHGFFIPAVVLYLIWMKSEELKKLPCQPSWVGLVVIIWAFFLHFIGKILYVFSISGFSIFFLILGLSLFLVGRPITKALLFPILFLLFMFPLPENIITTISFPLKNLVAFTSVALVKMMGIPIFIEGVHITIPSGSLLVDNPCSGLRSLITFLALGAIFAHLLEASMIKKAFLLFLTIPIALLVNLLRVILLILISHQWGLDAAAADTFLHSFTGAIMFVLGLFFLSCSSKLLCGRKSWKCD